MQLYKISDEFKAIQSLFESGEIDSDTFDATMEGIRGEFDEKARNCLMMARQLQADSEAIKNETERLKSLKKSADANAERLIDYVRHNMERIGLDKLSLGIFGVTLKKAAKTMLISNENAIPSRFWMVVPETKALDKASIAAALKAGEIVGGAELVDGKRALLIR